MSTLTTDSITQVDLDKAINSINQFEIDEIDTYVILTPASRKNGSWENFSYEIGQAKEGKSLLWSWKREISEKVSRAKWFGFVEQAGGKDNILLFPIKDILENTKGRIHWDDTHNANTIVMNPSMTIRSWTEYKEETGADPNWRIQGTMCRKLPTKWRL